MLEALRRLGADAYDAAYVGDSPFDIRAGKAAGVLSVAVGWGGIHPDERLLPRIPTRSSSIRRRSSARLTRRQSCAVVRGGQEKATRANGVAISSRSPNWIRPRGLKETASLTIPVTARSSGGTPRNTL